MADAALGATMRLGATMGTVGTLNLTKKLEFLPQLLRRGNQFNAEYFECMLGRAFGEAAAGDGQSGLPPVWFLQSGLPP